MSKQALLLFIVVVGWRAILLASSFQLPSWRVAPTWPPPPLRGLQWRSDVPAGILKTSQGGGEGERDTADDGDGNNLVDWDGIGALGENQINSEPTSSLLMAPKDGNANDSVQQSVQEPRNDPPIATNQPSTLYPARPNTSIESKNAPSLSGGGAGGGAGGGSSAAKRDDGVYDPPVVYSRKFTGSSSSSLFSNQQRPSERSSIRDEMMEREYNLAGWFERTLPLQATFVAVLLVFVVYISQQPPSESTATLLPSFDTSIDESLLPDFWSQFQGGTDRIDIEEIGIASGESVFI